MNALGLGLVLTLASVLGSPSSAQTKMRPARNPDTSTPRSVDALPVTCGKNKIKSHEDVSVGKVGDEFVARTMAAGTMHT